jgi:pimeloyl-ACP methyl ester carboxylesterase
MTSASTHRRGSGEPMVLIHGFSATGAMWSPVREALEGSFDVLIVNLAGHVGGPEIPAGTDVSVEALVDAVERDMDAAGFSDAHLVGNSLGGWISLELAKRGRARSVVAISPAGGWEVGTRSERRLRPLFERNHKMSSRFMPRLQRWLRRPRLRRALLSQVVARGDRIPAPVALQMIRDSVNCAVYFELLDAIVRSGPPTSFEGVDCSVTLVWGTKDRILPRRTYSGRLRDMLPAAQWVELKGLGHCPMSDDPELVARTITSFARRAPDGVPEKDELEHGSFTVA